MQIAILNTGLDIYDISLNEEDGERLLMDGSLRTAILISVLTEKRATPEIALDKSDLRGWYGDPEMGSWLWTLSNRTVTTETLQLADQYIRDSLEWMAEDGIIDSTKDIAIELTHTRNRVIDAKIGIKRPKAVAPQWIAAWSMTL